MSVNRYCAPGCGRARRQITRDPAGQALRSNSSVSSTISPLSRTVPSVLIAGCQASAGTSVMASWILGSTARPTEYRTPRWRQPARNARVVPALSARIRICGPPWSCRLGWMGWVGRARATEPGPGLARSGGQRRCCCRRCPGAGSRPGLRLRIRRGGRGRPAKDGTRSRACRSGWRLACLWAVSSVASTSKVNLAGSVRSGPPPAAHTRARASARAARSSSSWAVPTRSSTRPGRCAGGPLSVSISAAARPWVRPV